MRHFSGDTAQLLRQLAKQRKRLIEAHRHGIDDGGIASQLLRSTDDTIARYRSINKGAARRAATMTAPYDHVRNLYSLGVITQGEWDWYRFFWTWSAHRFSTVERSGPRQERAYERLGRDRFERRIARVRRLIARLQAH